MGGRQKNHYFAHLPMISLEQSYDERSLLQRLRLGENDAFLELYNIYHSALYNYVLRFVKIPAIAEDILQDTFLKIWEIRDRIDPDLSFKAYLYRICRNNVFKLVKKIAGDESLRLRVMLQFRQGVSDADLKVRWQQYEEILHTAIDQLPPQRQRVFMLCREEGLTYDQAAAELGISRNTVKEHMVLAMKFIKEYFQHHGDASLGVVLFLLTRNR
ncbi:MAG TPA: RNA polymerase sigma-70 factor [Puia sp.]|nr:RNA polymerase sigma-70 factor [Puia sp.]